MAYLPSLPANAVLPDVLRAYAHAASACSAARPPVRPDLEPEVSAC